MKLKTPTKFFVIIIATVALMIVGYSILAPNYGFGPCGDIATLGNVVSRACIEWFEQNYSDARQIMIKCWDADKDGTLDGGTSCNQDNLETLGDKIYNTGSCSDGIGNNEQAIRRLCDFSR